MAAPASEQIRSYLRSHPLPGLAEPAEITPVPSPADEQRFLISSGATRLVLKRYAPASAARAEREAAGLRLGGQMALAPALLLYDASGEGLGGPVIAFTAPTGGPIGGRPLSDDEIQGWLFLLLTLHHLPPSEVRATSALSPDVATWWQRMQPAWQACRASYTAPTARPLLDTLTKLYAIVGARVEARLSLWRDVGRRPCHGNAVPAHVSRDSARLTLVEWGDFGLGDPALDIGRAAGLAALTGELTREQHAQFIGTYLRGASDFADKTLADRIIVYTSVLPFGFALVLLELLASSRPSADRATQLEQVAHALEWTAEALGISIGDPRALLAPLR